MIPNAVSRHAFVAQQQQLLADLALAVQHLGDVLLRVLRQSAGPAAQQFECPVQLPQHAVIDALPVKRGERLRREVGECRAGCSRRRATPPCAAPARECYPDNCPAARRQSAAPARLPALSGSGGARSRSRRCDPEEWPGHVRRTGPGGPPCRSSPRWRCE